MADVLFRSYVTSVVQRQPGLQIINWTGRSETQKMQKMQKTLGVYKTCWFVNSYISVVKDQSSLAVCLAHRKAQKLKSSNAK
jgi:hypothetical protein